jgi:putative cell wall-binding protein
MKEKLLATFVLAALLLTVSVNAQEETPVVLSTDSNCPDALVTSVAANKIGAPVLLTDPDTLSSETEEELGELTVETLYIIGGPEVVSPGIEESLAETYEVVRLWGTTRYGTAVEVATYFWETAPKVLLVWDTLEGPHEGRCGLISEAKDLAIQEDIPVLLIPQDSIPEQVAEALVTLGTEEVILVGNLGSAVTDALAGLEIEVSEELKGTDINETKERVREKVRLKIRTRTERPLVVVAVGHWSDTIKVPYRPNGTSRHISSEDQIDDLITEIEENNYTNIKVVGQPELAQTVYDRLAEAGIDADLVSGRNAAAVAAAVMRQELARIRARSAAIKEHIRQMYQRRVTAELNNSDSFIERARALLNEATLPEATKERVLGQLREIKRDIDDKVSAGNYSQAWAVYNKLKSRVARITWDYRSRLVSAYRNLIQQETRLQTAVHKLSTLRQRVLAASAD